MRHVLVEPPTKKHIHGVVKLMPLKHFCTADLAHSDTLWEAETRTKIFEFGGKEKEKQKDIVTWLKENQTF